jgi:hypothetical protein
MSIANVSVQLLRALEPLRTHAAAEVLVIQLNMQLTIGFGLKDITAERALELGMTKSGRKWTKVSRKSVESSKFPPTKSHLVCEQM